MRVLVDTSIWSAALRRAGPQPPEAAELAELVRQGNVEMIGAVRQELLSGIRHVAQFQRVRNYLRAFPDLPVETTDYEQAAEFFNACRGHGIQGSNTDYLLCAVASRRGLSLYTTDRDFASFAKYVPVTLYNP